MELAGIILIAVAAVVECVFGILYTFKKLPPNPHMPIALMSGVVFAVAGLILYLAG